VLDRIRQAYQTVRDDLADPGQGPPLDARTTTVFVVATVLLTVFYYYGKTRFYFRSVRPWFESSYPEWSEWFEMMPYVYWGTMSIVIRVFVPVLVIVLLLRERPRDYGMSLNGFRKHLPLYLGLYAFMFPFLWWAAHQPGFAETYPFYDRAHEGGWHFVGYELVYGLQFVGVEFFFRGFLTFALFKRFGYHALFIVAVPYVMIHFNKPVPETIGALVAGVVLSYLALKSGNIWLGVLLHFGIAVTMDTMAIAAANGGLSFDLLHHLVTGSGLDAAAAAITVPVGGVPTG